MQAERNSDGGRALSPPELTKLVNILERLGSSFDGERAAAGLLASRLLQKRGLRWADVVVRSASSDKSSTASPHDWRAAALQALDAAGAALTEWETGFLRSLLKRRSISAKQRVVLDEIVAKAAG